jgi:HK97 family phage major capsid protein
MSTGVFGSIITRADADALIPEQDASQIIKLATAQSAALSLFRTVRMSSKTFRQPVLSALAQAYWVNGDTGLKQTTDVNWTGVMLEAEEVASIVPIPDSVVSDSGFPLWDECREAVSEAIAIKLDQAVFSGIDKPPTWPDALIPAAIAAGNENTADSTVEDGGIANDVAETFDDVEDDGFDVTAIAARRSLRALLRRARDSGGQRLLDVNTQSVLEAPVTYVANGVFSGDILAITGEFDLAVIGIRQDISFKMLDQAVLTDSTGAIVANLAQQDMQALRVTARFAYATAVPVSRPEADSGTPFPFAVLHAAPAGP